MVSLVTVLGCIFVHHCIEGSTRTTDLRMIGTCDRLCPRSTRTSASHISDLGHDELHSLTGSVCVVRLVSRTSSRLRSCPILIMSGLLWRPGQASLSLTAALSEKSAPCFPDGPLPPSILVKIVNMQAHSRKMLVSGLGELVTGLTCLGTLSECQLQNSTFFRQSSRARLRQDC